MKISDRKANVDKSGDGCGAGTGVDGRLHGRPPNRRRIRPALIGLVFFFFLASIALIKIWTDKGVSSEAATPAADESLTDQLDRAKAVIPTDYRPAVLEALVAAGANAGPLTEALLAVEPGQRKAMAFLIANMPEQDLKSLSLDFLLRNVHYAFKVRRGLPCTGKVPEDIFLNYVLPYANVNERRDEWRPDLYDRFIESARTGSSLNEVVYRIKLEIFNLFQLKFDSNKKRLPLWSPYESAERGFVSCGEASVMVIDACRAVGIPARLVMIPRWPHLRAGHIWLEVYDRGRWRLLRSWGRTGLDQGWIISRVREVLLSGPAKPEHRIYAASFKKTGLHIVFGPEVSFIDVSDRYVNYGEE